VKRRREKSSCNEQFQFLLFQRCPSCSSRSGGGLCPDPSRLREMFPLISSTPSTSSVDGESESSDSESESSSDGGQKLKSAELVLLQETGGLPYHGLPPPTSHFVTSMYWLGLCCWAGRQREFHDPIIAEAEHRLCSKAPKCP